MNKIDFKNKGEEGYENSKINATNLNQLQTNTEDAIEDVNQASMKLNDRGGSTNYNDFVTSGYYQCNFQNGTNAPDTYSTGMLLVLKSYYISQLFLGSLNETSKAFFRMSEDNGSSWTNWKEL